MEYTAENTDQLVPVWFWETLESAERKLKQLEATLETFERRKLEEFYGYHAVASGELCAPWEGPYINESIQYLSEDSTEDLTNWIVSQGRDYWLSVLNGTVSLQEAFWQRHASELEEEGALPKWDNSVTENACRGYQGPGMIVIPMLEKRFGVDFYDVEDEILKRVGY